MPTSLVTGGNGFVGSTVVDELLAQKHHVILAVRNASGAEALIAHHPEWPVQNISVVTVADFTQPGAFDAVFKEHTDIDYVVHVAAPLLDDPRNTDFVEHFEKPSVLGNTGLLQSAKQYGSNVKAISITGSINAITFGAQDDIKSRVFGNDSWLPAGRDEAIQAQNSYVSYCVGKKVAEEAVWKFVKEERPSFSVTNFMPPLIFGPMRQKVTSVHKINFSNGQIQAIMNSATSEGGKVPNTMFPGYIDVRDLAKLQVLALTTPGAANKRFVVGHPALFNQFADVLRGDAQLKISSRIGSNNDDASKLMLPRFDTKDTEDVFHFQWTSMEDTTRAVAADILKIEAQET